jgi:hypothetical protein
VIETTGVKRTKVSQLMFPTFPAKAEMIIKIHVKSLERLHFQPVATAAPFESGST